MEPIKWQDPPAARSSAHGRAREIDLIVAELKRDPGRWALVGTGKSTNAGTAWRKRGCEVRMHVTDRDHAKGDLYARWPGDGAS